MHSSLILTVLVLFSIILPDLVNIITSNFTVVDAELKYYKFVGSDINKQKNKLVENLKMRYVNFFEENDIKSKENSNNDEFLQIQHQEI